MKTSATIVREARFSAHLSQRDLGTRAGMPQSAISTYESGRVEPSLPVLRRIVEAAGFALTFAFEPLTHEATHVFVGPVGRALQRHRSELRRLLEVNRLEDAQIFGSVARGDDTLASDIDIVVDVPRDFGLFDLARVASDAEMLVGHPIDLVPRDGLKTAVARRIRPDLVPL